MTSFLLVQITGRQYTHAEPRYAFISHVDGSVAGVRYWGVEINAGCVKLEEPHHVLREGTIACQLESDFHDVDVRDMGQCVSRSTNSNSVKVLDLRYAATRPTSLKR